MTMGAAVASPDLTDAGGHVVAAGFERFYADTAPRLAAYCYGLIGDEQTAADIAQEAFTRLFARLRTVREPSAWLYLVATNMCRDHWRGEQRARRAHTELVSRTTNVPAHDPGLRDLVERLPERLRTCVLLHYYADLPVEQVAAAVHRPTGTVKRRLLEARRLLARDLEGTR